MARIKSHPVLFIPEGRRTVSFLFNGSEEKGFVGEPRSLRSGAGKPVFPFIPRMVRLRGSSAPMDNVPNARCLSMEFQRNHA